MKNLFSLLRLAILVFAGTLISSCDKAIEETATALKAEPLQTVQATVTDLPFNWNGVDIKIGPDKLLYVLDNEKRAIHKIISDSLCESIKLPAKLYKDNPDHPGSYDFVPFGFELLSDGSIFFGGQIYDRLLSPDGTIRTLYVPEEYDIGDGAEAGNGIAKEDRVTKNLYTASQIYVFKQGTNFNTTLLASTGYLNYAMDITSSGIIWIAGAESILRITSDGNLTRYGRDEADQLPPEGDLTAFGIERVATGIAVTRDGSIVYFTDNGKIKKIQDGKVSVITEIGPELINGGDTRISITLSADENALYCVGDVYGKKIVKVVL